MKNARRLAVTLVLFVLSSLALAQESEESRREALRAALDRATSKEEYFRILRELESTTPGSARAPEDRQAGEAPPAAVPPARERSGLAKTLYDELWKWFRAKERLARFENGPRVSDLLDEWEGARDSSELAGTSLADRLTRLRERLPEYREAFETALWDYVDAFLDPGAEWMEPGEASLPLLAQELDLLDSLLDERKRDSLESALEPDEIRALEERRGAIRQAYEERRVEVERLKKVPAEKVDELGARASDLAALERVIPVLEEALAIEDDGERSRFLEARLGERDLWDVEYQNSFGRSEGEPSSGWNEVAAVAGASRKELARWSEDLQGAKDSLTEDLRKRKDGYLDAIKVLNANAADVSSAADFNLDAGNPRVAFEKLMKETELLVGLAAAGGELGLTSEDTTAIEIRLAKLGAEYDRRQDDFGALLAARQEEEREAREAKRRRIEEATRWDHIGAVAGGVFDGVKGMATDVIEGITSVDDLAWALGRHGLTRTADQMVDAFDRKITALPARLDRLTDPQTVRDPVSFREAIGDVAHASGNALLALEGVLQAGKMARGGTKALAGSADDVAGMGAKLKEAAGAAGDVSTASKLTRAAGRVEALSDDLKAVARLEDDAAAASRAAREATGDPVLFAEKSRQAQDLARKADEARALARKNNLEAQSALREMEESAASRAESALGRELTGAQREAVENAHGVGRGQAGKDGAPAGQGNYTRAQIDEKARILDEAGFSKTERRALMEEGIVGDDLGRAKAKQVIRMTAKQAKEAAGKLGFTRISELSHGQPIFKKRNKYISPDVDQHGGGVWKMADSPEALRSKSTRLGTFDANLNRIGD